MLKKIEEKLKNTMQLYESDEYGLFLDVLYRDYHNIITVPFMLEVNELWNKMHKVK
jgi:hypothetical protein